MASRGSGDEKSKSQGNLFEWAESAARLIGATAQDLCGAARTVSSIAITVLVPSWLTLLATAADGYQGLRIALALATVITFICFISSWLVRGLRSRVRQPGITIIFQAAGFAGVVLAFGIVLHAGLRLEGELSAAVE